jgi:hypothetical protein
MKPIIDQTEFVRSHGKHPRGEGYWAFCPQRDYSRHDYLDRVVWIRGPFHKAARLAQERFAKKADVIVVCS